MITQSSPLAQLLGLAESDRLAARDVARENVIKRIGPRPERSQFDQHAARQWPPYIVHTVTVLTVIVIVAFFSISAMRLFTIGSHTFGQKIGETGPRLIAGIAVVLGSEAGALAFMLAAGVLAEGKREKRTFYVLAVSSTLIALVGNTQFALGGGWQDRLLSDPFAILEATLPPSVVLGAALVFERLWLVDIRRRHENERAYQAAFADWKSATDDPERSPYWQQAYANALKARLIEVNIKGRGQAERRGILETLTAADWRALVYRELQADQWFEAAQPDQVLTSPVAVAAIAPRPQHQDDPKRDQELAVHPLELIGPNGHNGNGTH